MALLTFDGLETMGGDANNPVDATFSRRYYSSDPNDIRVMTGKYGRLGFYLIDTGGVFQFRSGPVGAYGTDTTKIWGWSMRSPNNTSSAYYLARWITDASQFACGLKIFQDGTVVLYDRAASIIGMSPPGQARARAWNTYEAKIYCHSSAGTFELYTNSELSFSLTGLDTNSSSGTYHTRCYFYSQSAQVAIATRYDDFYICDTAGSTFNDFVGEFTTVASFPTGDDTSDWTPSTGNDHYALVDEAEPDDDTTYIDGTTATDVDKFTTTNLAAGINAVLAVVLGTDARLDSAGSKSYKQLLDSGGTDYDGQTQALTTTDWVYTYDVWEEDPDTSSPWTVDDYNATIPGVEVVS